MPAKKKASTSKATVSDCPIDWDIFPMDQATWDAVAKKLNLSPRHKQIVERILHGRQRKEIVEDLNSSAGTIDEHCKRIYQYHKTGGRDGLVLLIFKLAMNEMRALVESEHQCH